MLKIVIITSLIFISSCVLLPMETRVYYQATTTKDYDDVLAELDIAISDANFRITGHSRVGKVIRDRGTLNFPNYDTVQFCNLTHAKTLLQLSPHSVRHMPCNVVVYEYQHHVIVKTPLLPINTDHQELNRFSKKINTMLKEIVDFSVEE